MEVNIPGSNNPQKMPEINFGPFVKPAIILVVVFSVLSTAFFQVDKDEAGVVQRFGEYVRRTDPGLHVKIPFGIETVKLIKTSSEYEQEFGYRTVNRANTSFFDSGNSRYGRGSNMYLAESIMLTGDLNVAQIEWAIKYNVNDPVAFAFNVRDPHETIHDVSEAVVRMVVGDHTVDEVITEGRTIIRAEVKRKLQEILDSYNMGVTINLVNFKNNTPPAEVAPAFQEVNEARQEQDTLRNQAKREYNRVIPKARGQAEQMLREAEGYALERVNRAQGDAQRFTLALEEYKKAPDVTKKRLYLETLSQVMPNLKDKMIMDESQQGLLPFLNLNDSGSQEVAR